MGVGCQQLPGDERPSHGRRHYFLGREDAQQVVHLEDRLSCDPPDLSRPARRGCLVRRRDRILPRLGRTTLTEPFLQRLALSKVQSDFHRTPGQGGQTEGAVRRAGARSQGGSSKILLSASSDRQARRLDVRDPSETVRRAAAQALLISSSRRVAGVQPAATSGGWTASLSEDHSLRDVRPIRSAQG